MKSDHRHELKTNELADWLAHFPQWVRENQTTLIAAGVIIVVAIALYFVKFYRKDVAEVRHHAQLTSLVTQVPTQKRAIAQAGSQGMDQSIALLSVAQDLQAFADSTADDPLVALALIKRAEALRSELHYRLVDASREDLTRQIAQAQSSYQKALERASGNPALAAMAEFGLGLCDEELGNFDGARAAYRAVAENASYEGTAAQAAAAHRLATMDDYQGAVVFKPAPQPKPEAASVPTIQIGPDAVNSPIVIQAPNSVSEISATPAVVPDSNAVSDANEGSSAAGATEVVEANEPASN